MVDWIVYLLTAGVAGLILAFVIALFRVGPGKPEFSFPKAAIACLILTVGGPFGAIEVQTKRFQSEFNPVITRWYDDSEYVDRSEDANGIAYWKVLYRNQTNAYILVVCKEQDKYGWMDRPVYRLKLFKDKKNKWVVDEDASEVLRSNRLNKDNFVWPPFS